jgi:hypothetical protein
MMGFGMPTQAAQASPAAAMKEEVDLLGVAG